MALKIVTDMLPKSIALRMSICNFLIVCFILRLLCVEPWLGCVELSLQRCPLRTVGIRLFWIETIGIRMFAHAMLLIHTSAPTFSFNLKYALLKSRDCQSDIKILPLESEYIIACVLNSRFLRFFPVGIVRNCA